VLARWLNHQAGVVEHPWEPPPRRG
jgi:hypothetical protein